MTKRKRNLDSDSVPVTRGSDNVFADIGVPNPEDALARAQIAMEIDRVIHERKLTRRTAAARMDIDAGTLALLLRGRLRDFSVQRLRHMLDALGPDTPAAQPTSPTLTRLLR